MYITNLVVENLRCVRRLDFGFGRHDKRGPFAGWTVLLGDNGSGKTTLLKAIAIALVGPDIARALQPSFRGWILSGCQSAKVTVRIIPGETEGFSGPGRTPDKVKARLSWQQNGGPEVSLKVESTPSTGMYRGPWADNTYGWFCVGYGPFRRLYGASPDAQRLMSGPERVARFATMFMEAATLGECEQWLRDLNYRALEQRPRDRQLLEDVKRLLDDDFLPRGVRIERVDSDGLWLRDSFGVVLPLADLSEGYRAALALMIDLLRHIAAGLVSGNLVETDADGRLVVPHPGVVLIDEVDAHLHPLWQREIGFWLKRRFPRIQFIVTTHSPLVCQAADPNGIFVLSPPGGDDAPRALDAEEYGRLTDGTADSILLGPAFGLTHTRSPRAVADRNDYSRLRAKKLGGGLSADESRQMSLLESRIYPDDGLDPER